MESGMRNKNGREWIAWCLEEKHRKKEMAAVGGFVIVLVLILCCAGWRGLHQQNATAALKDVFDQARVNGKEKAFRINFRGKNFCEADYMGAELSEAQFARVKRSTAPLVEQQVKVIESKDGRSGVGEMEHRDEIYEEKGMEDVHVYQMKGRSRFYLLVEDGESGKVYVARFQNCYGTNDAAFNIEGVFKDFQQIEGAGDIRQITLEDTKTIKEGQSNILAVYTEERVNELLYQNLGGISLKESFFEEELLHSVYGDGTTEEEMGREGYYIEVENKQGEISLWRYQKTDKVDYLLMHGEGKTAVPVPEQQKKFWREVFDRNARLDNAKTLAEVIGCPERNLYRAQFLYPEGCSDSNETLSLDIYPLHEDENPAVSSSTEVEENLKNEKYMELYEKFLRAEVGQELSKVKKEKIQGACYLYCDGTVLEDDGAEEMAVEIIKYSDYIKVQNNQGYPVVKKYYALTSEMERLFEEGEGYARKEYDDLKNSGEILMEKPIIYLYPEKMQNIHVEVKNVDFTTVYPDYDGGWDVRAQRDGTLQLCQKDGEPLDKGREYYALYYEGETSLREDWQRGFTVEKKDYKGFLEKKLRILGLSDREAEEFILYWLPRMEKYPSVDLHFAEQSLLDEKVPLEISPKPDTVIRVFMQWRKHLDGKNIPQQELSPVARKGYIAVEWGGSESTGD